MDRKENLPLVNLSAYLRWLIFLPEILIPACASSSLAFHMMYSAYKLNKQNDNTHPWRTPFPVWNQSVIPCINNLWYTDDTTIMAESRQELMSFLMKVKKESEKVGLKLNIQKTTFTVSSPITSWKIDGQTVETVADFILGGSKITVFWPGEFHGHNWVTFTSLTQFNFPFFVVFLSSSLEQKD